MAKPTLSKDDLPFVYKLGQDVAKLTTEIDKIKGKSGKALRVTVPAKPEKYADYTLQAAVVLPDEYKNAICIKSQGTDISLIKTTDSLTIQASEVEQVLLLAPIYRLENQDIAAEFDVAQLGKIDAELKAKANAAYAYKYLAKLLTEKYLDAVRAKTRTSDFESQGIKAYVNQGGIDELLSKPFEMSVASSNRNINPSIYADAKAEIADIKAKIDSGEIDTSSAKDFEIVKYNYFDSL